MIVFVVLVSAAISYAPCCIGQFLIVRSYHASVAAYGHVLCRIEREASGVSDRTDLSSLEFGAVCLASIFNQAEARFSRHVVEFINSRWVSVQLHWYQCSCRGTSVCPSR